MSLFRPRKESVIFFIGFFGIIGIVVFYGNSYFKKHKAQSMLSTQIESAPVADDESFISYEGVLEKRQQDPSKIILIDIRSNELFSSEHVPQSTNIPFELIDALNIKEGFTFVLITASGNEQGIGIMALQALQEKNDTAPIFILRGGFDGWKNSGGKTITFGDPESVTDQSKVNYITPEKLKGNLSARQSYFIIDMRSKDDYDQGHVPGAVNLPFDQLETFYGKIPAAAKIVSYGNSELEDFQSGVRLFDLGFFSTEVLKGGFSAWKDKGFEAQK
ncbi:MAG: rhodanese-like domain-containing protein [Candidatus Moranbacteria bacterium]|nr:rhodanese-like domain-containing protein [Candidatus Moranbacteria bacterium]